MNVALSVHFIDYDILSLVPERYSFETAYPAYSMVIDDTHMAATTDYSDTVKRIVIPNYDAAVSLTL